MRLWHEDLLDKLPKQWISGQHRECCALRGNGWGNKQSTVDYLFDHDIERLVAYHLRVMQIAEEHGINVDPIWKKVNYRGKSVGFVKGISVEKVKDVIREKIKTGVFYPEHAEGYLEVCLDNLYDKMTGKTLRYNGTEYSDEHKKQMREVLEQFDGYLERKEKA